MQIRTKIILVGIGLVASLATFHFLSDDTISPDTTIVTVSDRPDFSTLADRWKALIVEQGPEAAYAQFKEDLRYSGGHLYAHLFGELLYEFAGPELFHTCDSTASFGCYHGFSVLAIAAEGIEVINKLDQACLDRWGVDSYAPCQHGIGHGLLSYVGYANLEEALRLCQTISSESGGGCESGVFMDFNYRYNFENATTIDELEIREPTEDLHFPCNAVPDAFVSYCYISQPEWWMDILDKDWKKLGELCADIDNPGYQRTCFQAVGNFSSSRQHYNAEAAIEACQLMPSIAARNWCFDGAMYNSLPGTGNFEMGERICAVYETQEATDLCIEKLHNSFDVTRIKN